jgi:hypothetical protein
MTDAVDRHAVIAIIHQWFPGDSINSEKWAGKGIVEDINALPSLESVDALVAAGRDLGGWLSAALDDDSACYAFKTDINAWFAALSAFDKE